MCWVLLHNDCVQGSMIIDGLSCLIGVLIDKDVITVGIWHLNAHCSYFPLFLVYIACLQFIVCSS